MEKNSHAFIFYKIMKFPLTIHHCNYGGFIYYFVMHDPEWDCDEEKKTQPKHM